MKKRVQTEGSPPETITLDTGGLVKGVSYSRVGLLGRGESRTYSVGKACVSVPRKGVGKGVASERVMGTCEIRGNSGGQPGGVGVHFLLLFQAKVCILPGASLRIHLLEIRHYTRTFKKNRTA